MKIRSLNAVCSITRREERCRAETIDGAIVSRGLVIDQPWVSLIVDGKKVWEMRTRPWGLGNTGSREGVEGPEPGSPRHVLLLSPPVAFEPRSAIEHEPDVDVLADQLLLDPLAQDGQAERHHRRVQLGRGADVVALCQIIRDGDLAHVSPL
jgi:hypothetical protein